MIPNQTDPLQAVIIVRRRKSLAFSSRVNFFGAAGGAKRSTCLVRTHQFVFLTENLHLPERFDIKIRHYYLSIRLVNVVGF